MAESSPSRSQSVVVGVGTAAAVLCAGRCVLSTYCRLWGPRRARERAEAVGVQLELGSLSVLGPTASPLSLTLGLSGLKVDLDSVFASILPGCALGGELTLGRLELRISPLSGTAWLLVRDLKAELRPLELGSREEREERLRQAQRFAREYRHLLLDAAQAGFWMRRAAARAAGEREEDEDEDDEPVPEDEPVSGSSSDDDDDDDDDDSDEESDDGSNDDGYDQDSVYGGGAGVALLRKRRALDHALAPPARLGWVTFAIRKAAARYALGLLDRTDVLIQNVSLAVHSAAAAPDGTEAAADPADTAVTLALKEVSLGKAPFAADQLADRSVIHDPQTAVPTHVETLGRRSALVRRDPLSADLSLSALPRSIWTRKTAVSPTISLSLIPQRQQRWFPAARLDRRLDDQKKLPVTAFTAGPISLLPSIHSLKVVGLTVRTDAHTVLEQKMMRVDMSAVVDEHCWMRALDFVVLDAVSVTTMPLEAHASLAPVMRGMAHATAALRYAHQHMERPAEEPLQATRRTPSAGHPRRRGAELWQFAFRCVQEELRRVRPPAVLRWSKLSTMLDYQKQWLRFIGQAQGIGPSARPMLHLIQSLARETIASMAPDFRQEGERSAKVLVTRTHAEEWIRWVRKRRGSSGTGRITLATEVARIVTADLMAAPELAVRLWARRRHLIHATVTLILLEIQPAGVGAGAANGGGLMLSTEEIVTLRDRAVLDHPDWALPVVDVIAKFPAECVVSLILRELHVSLHGGASSCSGVFCRVGDVGMAARVTSNYDAHEVELAVGNVNAVQNLTSDVLVTKAAKRDFLRSEANAALVLVRSSLDVESRTVRTAVRISRLTVQAHLPALEVLARSAVRSVEAMAVRVDAGRRADEYAPLVDAPANFSSTQRTEWLSLIAPSLSGRASWLMPATDQAGVFLLQNHLSHSFELDADGPALTINQAGTGPQLTIWAGMLEATLQTSERPMGLAGSAEGALSAFGTFLPRTLGGKDCAKLFSNIEAAWSGFLVSMTHDLDGIPTKIRFNREFEWKAYASSCTLPPQFSALCGVPVAMIKCDLAKIDCFASPADLASMSTLVSGVSTTVHAIAERFSSGVLDPEQHEVPDDMALHRSTSQLLEEAEANQFAKADIPGPHRKPRGKRPASAVRWDGDTGDWLDDDGNVALMPPMDDSNFTGDADTPGASIVDQTMLEIVVDPHPITFTLKQNRGRPLLLLALDWDNVHISQGARAVYISADLLLQAHFDNANLATWEPVIEPWAAQLQIEVSRKRSVLSFVSEKCLNANLSPAFLQGLRVSTAAVWTAPSRPFEDAATDFASSPYWLRNSCGTRIEVRMTAGRDESPAYLVVANQESVALDAADYGAPAIEVVDEGMALTKIGGCDLHVRYQIGDQEVGYQFVGINRVDTHLPQGDLAGRPDVVCYVHITSDGTKICEVCSRLRLHNRTRGQVEFGFSDSAVTVTLEEGEVGYAPPYHSDAVFVRPNRKYDWAELPIAGEVHRGVARCDRIGVQAVGFTACFSCEMPDENCPVSVLSLFDALTLQNMLPTPVKLEIYASAGEAAAEATCTLAFGESFVVPNWLPTQPAWVVVVDCRGATSHRTLIHETEVDKTWAKFGGTPKSELGHVGVEKRKVGALKQTSRVEANLRLRGGQFAVKHTANSKLNSTDHFGVAIDHKDLMDEGHTVTIHVSHCVINRTGSPLYVKTDSKTSFVPVAPWSATDPIPMQPIMLPSSRKAQHGLVNKVRFGCPVMQASPSESSHRLVVLGAAFVRDSASFGMAISPFATVLSNSKVIAETEVVRSTRFPVWNKSMPINISGRTAPMSVAVYDSRTVGPDSLLGEATIQVEEVRRDEDLILPLFTASGQRRATRRRSEDPQFPGDTLSGVWRSTSADRQITEYILLREGKDGDLTGSHVCGTGDTFKIQSGTHTNEEMNFEQVYEDGARIDWVGTLTSADTMVGTWHGTGVHGSFDAVRVRELDHADEAIGFLRVRLEESGPAGLNDDVHFVSGWSKELPVKHDLALAALPPIVIDLGRQGKRQIGICMEPPVMPLAPTMISIVPRFVFYNLCGATVMLVDVDSPWMATIEPGEHCEGFTTPRTCPINQRHRLVVRKLRNAGVFSDCSAIGVEEPGVKWGIFESDSGGDDAADMLTHLTGDIHAHCQLDAQGTMVVTLRKAADVDQPYRIINLAMMDLEYRPRVEGEIEVPQYQSLANNKAAALCEHLWRGVHSAGIGVKLHKLEVRIGGEERMFVLDRVNDRCPKWEVETGRGRVRLRPQVVVDRQGLSLRFSTTRAGMRCIDPHASKLEVLLLGGIGFSVISADKSRETGQVERRQELMYGRLDSICYTAYSSSGLRTTELSVAKIQLDDQISQQVVLRPRLSTTDRQLHFCMVRSGLAVEKVDLSVLPLVFNLKFPTAKRMNLWYQDFMDEAVELDREAVRATATDLLVQLMHPSYKSFAPVDAPMLRRIYIKTIRLRPIKLECTVDAVGANGDPLVGPMLAWTSEAGVNRMLLNVDAVVKDDWFDTQEGTAATLRKHYEEQTILNMFDLRGLDKLEVVRMLGSMEVFGSLGTKVKIVSEEKRNIELALRDRDAIGAALSGANMAKELMTSMVTTVSANAQGASERLKFRIGDVDSPGLRREHVTGVRQGLQQGGMILGEGLKDAVTGVVDKPIEGMRQDGVDGLARGVGDGLLGLALKPVAATLDFVSATTEGLAQAFDSNPLTDNGYSGRPSTMRSARAFGQHGALKEYSLGDVLLSKLSDYRQVVRHAGAMEERCIDLLVERDHSLPGREDHLSMVVLTNCSVVRLIAPVVVSRFAADEQLDALVRGTSPKQWEISWDLSLGDVFEAKFDAGRQRLSLRFPGQEMNLSCPRDPAGTDAEACGGVHHLLGFMDRVVKAAVHYQRQTHTLSDFTNDDPAGSLGAGQDAQMVQHAWLLIIRVGEVDPAPDVPLLASTEYDVEIYHPQDGVLESARTAGSASFKLDGYRRDCRMRVQRCVARAPQRQRMSQRQNGPAIETVLDVEMPAVGVAWVRKWRAEDVNVAQNEKDGRHIDRFDVDAPAQFSRGGTGGGGGGGAFSCLSAGGSNSGPPGSLTASADEAALVDLVVDASMEERVVHWGVAGRVAADEAAFSRNVFQVKQPMGDIAEQDGTESDFGSVAGGGEGALAWTADRSRSHHSFALPTDPLHASYRGTAMSMAATGADSTAVELQIRRAQMAVAAEEGDVETMAKLMHDDSTLLHARFASADESSIEFGGSSEGDATAVFLATLNGHAEAVRWLLQQAADGSRPAASGRTPLHVACSAGHDSCVRALVCDPKVNLTARADGGRTPAHCAAEHGQLECLRLVLHEGRCRGDPTVPTAMALTADGLDGMSVRETLDDWWYALVAAPVESELEDDIGALAAERDFLNAWIDAQKPLGLAADE